MDQVFQFGRVALTVCNDISFAVDAAINKLKNGKSPGLNGIPPKAYKAMNTKTQQQVHAYVATFFEGKADYNGWHLGCTLLFVLLLRLDLDCHSNLCITCNTVYY
jgi:hypothetical protein